MLEKLAEIVREEASDWDDYNDLTLRCMECDFKPILGEGCRNMSGKDCPLLFNREEKADFVDGSLMLARWAVLLVAKGLEVRLAAYEKAKDEYRKIHADDDSDEEWCAEQWFHRRAFQVSEAIRDLIAEAKEVKE